MARLASKKSNSGIYHVMIRGINKQLILEDDEDNQKLLDVLRKCKVVSEYIHNNPAKAGLSKSADNYQWSSYNEYIQSSNLVDVDFVLGTMNRVNLNAFTISRVMDLY